MSDNPFIPEEPGVQSEKSFAEQCKEYICPTCPDKLEADDARLRALAEMENFKKRLQREHDEQARYATESVLADLLPTLDNLELAIQYANKSEACKDLLQGVIMTRKILQDAVKAHGLIPVGAVGEVFNPDLHEAVAFDFNPDYEPGLVSRLLQPGYMLKDRLLRPAKVSVSREEG